MKLNTLAGPEIAVAPEYRDLDITGVTADSREARSGWLFAALPGARTDGARFVSQAISQGATAVLVPAGTDCTDVPTHVPVLQSPEPRRTLALMAARLYPDQPATTVAVTGTSGKTSVADFTRQIFAYLGHQSASVGTIGLVKPGGATYGGLTTPDPVALHRTLDELAREGITHLAFEASSHGLDQFRLDGVRLKAAGFTNLGRDHLDYHPSMEAYLAAKMRLFTELLPPDGTAVINADAEHAPQVIDAAKAAGRRVISTGTKGDALILESLKPDQFAQSMRIRHGSVTRDIRLPLLGAYQASNALLAAGLVMATGEPVDAVLTALSQLKGVKGRLEIMGLTRGGLVVIDYAHKPDALEAALTALRPFAAGRLVCVFGCGGDRDKGKRPIMGQIAAKLADSVIVTDDNPRSEDPHAIRAAILAGAPTAREIGDRAEAIRAGARLLGAGDVLLVAGKGHETGQIVGATVLPFSDHDVVRDVLTETSIA